MDFVSSGARGDKSRSGNRVGPHIRRAVAPGPHESEGICIATLAVLVDYDNVEQRNKVAGPVALARVLASVVPEDVVARHDAFLFRLYGGWRARGTLTQSAQRIVPDIRRDSPCVVKVIECDAEQELTGCSFFDCRVGSLAVLPDGDQTYDPTQIDQWLRKAGAQVGVASDANSAHDAVEVDDRVRQLERFFRVFLRSTHVDEEVIRLRLGKVFASSFFDAVVPDLLTGGVLEEVPWRGGGYQRRYKLILSMSTIERCLERSRGSYDEFLRLVQNPEA